MEGDKEVPPYPSSAFSLAKPSQEQEGRGVWKKGSTEVRFWVLRRAEKNGEYRREGVT